jgi:hypothetical protein
MGYERALLYPMLGSGWSLALGVGSGLWTRRPPVRCGLLAWVGFLAGSAATLGVAAGLDLTDGSRSLHVAEVLLPAIGLSLPTAWSVTRKSAEARDGSPTRRAG